MVRYPILYREIRESEFTVADIATCLGITQKSLYNKLNGKTEFTWSEVCAIIEHFFPYYDPQDLFAQPGQRMKGDPHEALPHEVQ